MSSEFAHVASLDALRDFRADLCTFGQRAQDGLSSVQMEVQRMLDWLGEQEKSWQREVRRWEEAVNQARAELARRKMIRIGDRAPDCTEQEDILRAALHRLDEAEDKLRKTRRWLPAFRRAVDEYQGPARQLSGFLEGEQPRALALLQQKIDALEAYARLTAPPPK
jgi:DNA repair exonuclease SbcCD ATPase subunit